MTSIKPLIFVMTLGSLALGSNTNAFAISSIHTPQIQLATHESCARGTPGCIPVMEKGVVKKFGKQH